jgi:hypothetical protein
MSARIAQSLLHGDQPGTLLGPTQALRTRRRRARSIAPSSGAGWRKGHRRSWQEALAALDPFAMAARITSDMVQIEFADDGGSSQSPAPRR